MADLQGFRETLEAAAGVLRRHWPVARIDAGRVLVVGDTHGYVEVTRWALSLARGLGVDWVIFLGDLVDRGPRGVENLEEAAGAVASGEPPVLVLRGNHEDLGMNVLYGFKWELLGKLGPEAEGVVKEFYESLPLAAVAGPVFLVHGGIPCRLCTGNPEPPYKVEEIEAEASRDPQGPAAFQLRWNDPHGRLLWFHPNPRGPGVYYYGRRAWRSFLQANGLRLIVRGHEVVDGVHLWTPDGFQDTIEGVRELRRLEASVVTVFSSLYHGGRAAVLLLDLERGFAEPYHYPYPSREPGH
ncbi:metallophosphoesterase [Stetteria hydrogenophila]